MQKARKNLIEPHELGPRLLAWSELNVNEVDMILYAFKMHNLAEVYIFLEKLLNLNCENLKEKILIDMHYYAIKLAIYNNFSKIQLSAFVSIVRALHRFNQETPFDNYKFLVKYFEELMICHSIKTPPFCADIFDSQKTRLIIDFVTNGYLKHYKMYKYVFTPNIGLDLKINYINHSPIPNDYETEDDSNDKLIVSDSSERINSAKTLKLASESNQFDAKKEMKTFIRNCLDEKLEKDAEIKQNIDRIIEEKLKQMHFDQQIKPKK